MPHRFEPGSSYKRTDLHDQYGGQRQGGISTPRDNPIIMLFTGSSGTQHGYVDDFTADGALVYTGEGQQGDMVFRSGNRAIRDHIRDGKELHVFTTAGMKRSFVRYQGEFAADSWTIETLPDGDGQPRKAIRFNLVPIHDADLPSGVPELATQRSLSELRELALAAATNTEEREATEAVRSFRERSRAVMAYALARADGRCESCHEPAPFLTKNGVPYLEVHHTRRLADGGPDHPLWVGAICPTCHRQIHYGADGDLLNEKLQAAISAREQA